MFSQGIWVVKILTGTQLLGYFTLQVVLFVSYQGWATTFHRAVLRLRLNGFYKRWQRKDKNLQEVLLTYRNWGRYMKRGRRTGRKIIHNNLSALSGYTYIWILWRYMVLWNLSLYSWMVYASLLNVSKQWWENGGKSVVSKKFSAFPGMFSFPGRESSSYYFSNPSCHTISLFVFYFKGELALKFSSAQWVAFKHKTITRVLLSKITAPWYSFAWYSSFSNEETSTIWEVHMSEDWTVPGFSVFSLKVIVPSPWSF